MDISRYFKVKADLINKTLEKYLPSENAFPPEIHSALRYSVLNGGKRFRPILSVATTEMLGGNVKDILPGACAIELIHNYSLIHDDLPCMDDDDFRRGRPTTHKQYGEATAILAGNALITVAFETMSQYALKGNFPENRMQKVMTEIAIASGMEGMVAGQSSDLEAENRDITKIMLAYIHSHKTGALINSAVRIGGFISGATQKEMSLLTQYGQDLGLMFQVTDDILDIESTQEKRGKKIGGDIELGKATYPKLHGMNRAKLLVEELIQNCYQNTKIFGRKADILNGIAEYVGHRAA